jgi:hypothetical protein
MLGWKDEAPSAEEIATVIARGLGGMAPDLLASAGAALEAGLAPLTQILPAGADLTRWRSLAGDRLAFWQDIQAHAGAGIDWPALEARLHAEGALLIELGAVRDRLLHGALSGLGRVNLGGIAGVGAAINAIEPPRDFRLTPILNGLRDQLESTAQRIEAWAPTEEELLALVRGLINQIVAYVEQSPLGQLRTLLVNFQQRILQAIEDLPLRDLALQAEAALHRLAAAIQVIDPDVIKQPVQDFFSTVETRLDAFTDNAVLDSVGDLWNSVGAALTQIAEQVNQLKTTLDGLTAQLQSLADNVQPSLQAITEAVGSIDAALADFDLEQPAQVVIGELNKLRDEVAALDLSDLPQAAVSGLKAGAEFLRKIDLAGTINPPLNDVLNEIDPSALIQAAADKIGGITAQLQLLDPAVLTRDLDGPVNELLSEFSQLGPDQFRHLLETALQPVEDAIHGLDFSELLAPITQLYAELSARVDALLDPDAIFAPLEALFQPLVDVVDALQPARFIELLAPRSDSLVEGVGAQAGPPAALTAANLKSALPPIPEADGDLFGFRLGDMLIPLIDLHRQLTQAFDSLDDTVLAQAAQGLRNALQGGLDALQPVAVATRVDGALQQVSGTFDPAQLSAQLGEAVFGYHDAVAAIATAAAAPTISADDAVVSVRVLGLVEGLNPLALLPERTQFDDLFRATAQVRARLDLGPLRAAQPGLMHIQRLLPGFLRLPELGADAIRQALVELDPAPLRVEINAFFDRIGQRIVALEQVIAAAFEELGRIAEEFILPVTPTALAHIADALHAGLKQQVLAFSPTRFKNDIQLIFDVVKNQLGAFDPTLIVQELNALRDALIRKLHDLLDQLLPDPAPFVTLQAQLAQLKPSQLLAPLVQTLQPISDLVAALNPQALFQPLVEAIARIREELPTVISEVEAALDEVLAAFPQGGTDSGGASVSVSAG